MKIKSDYFIVVLAAVFMLLPALGRWLGLSSNAWDLGIFNQFSWMLSRGYLIEPASLTGWPVLADHASFVLLPISFVYRFWSSPAFLLVFQTFALVGAPLVLLQVAKGAGLSTETRNLIVLAYFMQPVLWNAGWFDFHPDSLFPLAVFCFWLNVRQRRLCWMIFFGILILLIREAGVLVALGLSLTCLFKGQRSLSALLAFFAITWAAFLSGFWYPLFSLTEQHNSNNYSHFFDAALELYRQPLAFNHILQAFNQSSISSAPVFFFVLMLPWIFLLTSKSASWIAGSLVVLAPLALSVNTNLVSIDYHYGIMIFPFYALAAVESASESFLLKFSIYRFKPLLIVFYLVTTINLIVNLNFSLGWILFWRNPLPFFEYYGYLSRIPADQRVLTSNGLSAHISNRRVADFLARPAAQSFPEGFDILILNKTDPGFGSSPQKTHLLIEAAKKSGWTCDAFTVGHLSIEECAIK